MQPGAKVLLGTVYYHMGELNVDSGACPGPDAGPAAIQSFGVIRGSTSLANISTAVLSIPASVMIGGFIVQWDSEGDYRDLEWQECDNGSWGGGGVRSDAGQQFVRRDLLAVSVKDGKHRIG